jgi:NAD(P) transhydrogenase
MYDLVVLGSGPAGQRAAVQAAKLKKKVLVIERDGIGGACLHLGTIPSKTLREAALSSESLNDPLQSVMQRKDAVISAEAKVITEQLRRNSVEFIAGTGSFLSPREVQVKTNHGELLTYQGRHFVIATGTRPFRDPSIPFDNSSVFDSDTILKIPKLPASLAILGAGVIGCEYASIFAKLGVAVTLLDRRQELLRSVDQEVVAALDKHFRSSGVNMGLGSYPDCIQKNAEGRLQFNAGGKAFQVDAVLVCMGREGNSESLALDKAGITPLPRGLISVNTHYQTSIPHIYAVGDIIGAPALAASSAEQGRLASAHAFAGGKDAFPSSFPYGIYTIPEISSVGAQEEELKSKQIPYVVGRAHYRELARGKILGDDYGFLKLLVHKESHHILGVHVIGSGATELVHIGQMALSLEAKVEFLVANVFNYPTLAEAYKVAAYNAYNQLT